MKAKDDRATDHLVGIDDQVEAIMGLLDYDFGCARCLGIHGPGGIGKSTLAKALFNRLIPHFDRYCFLRDVRGSSHRDGLVFLQKKLLLNILGEIDPVVIDNIDDGMMVITEKLCYKKVLIVLDDVDHTEQLEKLIGKTNWFGRGSRIIITTQKKSILERGEKIILYELKEMNHDQVLELYKNHAFIREYPGDNYYDRLSGDIVSTIGGLPLIVKVIGSFLRGKHETVWVDTLEKLRSIAHEDVYHKLRISYDVLNFEQKQIFLDIACLPFHEEEINSSYMWEDSNLFPQKDIEVLRSLSLIHIRENGGLWMHDVLKDLGHQIVNEENLDPGKRSRLRIFEEAVDIVKTRENKGNTEAISLAGDPTLLIFTDEDFSRLPNLRFLELDGVSFTGDFANLFSKLRWFSWRHFPPDLIATNLFRQNLVVLQLSESDSAQAWEGWSQIKMLHNLKVLQLTRLNMVRINFSECFNLERLIIEECGRLVQIDHSIGELTQLAYLNIEGCYLLENLPSEIGLLVNLQHLSLSRCSRLSELPDTMGQLHSLIKLDLSYTLIKLLPWSVGCLVNLKSLSLAGCSEMRDLPYSTGHLESLIELDLSFAGIQDLPDSIGNLKSLKVIKLEYCQLLEFPLAIVLATKLEEIRARRCFTVKSEVLREIGKLSFLRILDLSYTPICRVPETIAALPQLEELILENCDELQVLPSLPTSLTSLSVSSRSLRLIPDLSNLTNLVNLLLSDGSEHCLLFSKSLSIETFNLEWIGKLSKLVNLELCLQNITMSLTALGSLSRLRKLYKEPPESALQGNFGLKRTFPGLSNLRNVTILKLCRCLEKEIQLGGLEQLRHLTVCDFPVLETIILSVSDLKNLKEMEIRDCPMLRVIYGLWTLETLKNQFCPLIGGLSNLSSLEKLMENRDQKVPMKRNSGGSNSRKMKKNDSSGEAESTLTMDSLETYLTYHSVGDPSVKVMKKPELVWTPQLHKRFGEAESTVTTDNSESTLTTDISVEDPSAVMMKKPPSFWRPQSHERFVEAESTMTSHNLELTLATDNLVEEPRFVWTPQLHKRFVDVVAQLGVKNAVPKTIIELMSVDTLTHKDVTSHLEKYELYLKRLQELYRGPDEVSRHSMEDKTNASDSLIPDECQVVIQDCPELGDTPWHGMLYKDHRHMILGLIESVSDAPINDSMDKVAKMKDKRQIDITEKDVGPDDKVNHILSLMNIHDKDNRIIVVIHGEGGIGKTTLAKLIHNQVSCDFDGCSFLAEIKEKTQVLGGLQLLQTQLISDVLKRELENVAFVNRGFEFFSDLFFNMRVLIILDDVENAFHVHKLIGDCFHCFASGSRILVTTRNSVILEESPQIRTYHVSRLDYDHALQLFRQQASIPTSPSHGNFWPLNLAVNATRGLPLFIEVMAAVFNGKLQKEWNNLLQRSLFQQWDIQSILGGGYRVLNDKQKQIFLDIACFTTGIDSRIAWYLWYDISFLPSCEILTPLAKIQENNQIWMHSALRQLGRGMVQRENLTDPRRRSRLFNHEIALDMIKQKKGTEKVEALCLNFQWHSSVKLTPEDFESMPNIRFLQMDHADIVGDFTNVLTKLRWLRWRGCPRQLQATNFHLGNLTILDLSWSKVTKDWEGWDQIEMQNLRVLDLTGCADLFVTPKFSGCQNLVRLILEQCSQLVKIDHSIGDLQCLVSLNMKFCTELSMLPVEVGHLTALQELLIDGTSVEDIPISIGHLKKLETLSASNCCSLSQLPRTLRHLTNISLLSLDGTRITALPDYIGELVRLKHLSLRDCRRIRKLPNSIGNIGRTLLELEMSGTGVFKFPDSLKNLQDLKVLRMDSCFFRDFPPVIGELTSLEEIHASWCRSLEGGIPSEVGKLHNLRILRLRHSTISSIPAEIHQLSNLQTLDLLHCDMIKELPRLPSSIMVLQVNDELKSSHLP